jgi:hypothetical protein
MTFKEVIDRNLETLADSKTKGWMKYAFHYTDISNAVSILDSGKLYSRINAESMGIMHSDNASNQVIEMTNSSATSHVRFYFRPQTPTQYYNEGFKHCKLRFGNDSKANVPVPIFFVFNLEKLLRREGTLFSEKQQSGHGSPLYKTPEEFSEFNFAKIYGYGAMAEPSLDKQYRHGEILVPDFLEIVEYLELILCRNDVEKMTLINLLKDKNRLAFRQYKDRIKVHSANYFENNGLYVNECQFYKNRITITFSDTSYKKRYTDRMMRILSVSENDLDPIDSRAELDWISGDTTLVHRAAALSIRYRNPQRITIKTFEPPKQAKKIRIKFFMQDMLVCLVEQPLSEVEVI